MIENDEWKVEEKKNPNLLKTCFTLKTELYYLFRQTNWILENELEFASKCVRKKKQMNDSYTDDAMAKICRTAAIFYFHSKIHSYTSEYSAINGVLIAQTEETAKKQTGKKKLIIDTKTKILLFVFIVFGGRLSKLNDCRKSRFTLIRVINKIMCSSE